MVLEENIRNFFQTNFNFRSTLFWLHQKRALNKYKKFFDGVTVHRSKGLEADYVILDGLSADKFGFPSEIEDDPLLSLVLARQDNFPHAEERRLFYVALTRARQQVHLIVDRNQPSPFALELLGDEYEVMHIGRNLHSNLGLTTSGLGECKECVP